MSFGKSFKAELGRNTGKWVSNKVFGNTGWATPRRHIIELEERQKRREKALAYKQSQYKESQTQKRIKTKNQEDVVKVNEKEVEEHNNYLEVIQSVHRSFSEKMDWEKIRDTHPPAYVETGDEAKKRIYELIEKDFINKSKELEAQKTDKIQQLQRYKIGKSKIDLKSSNPNVSQKLSGGCMGLAIITLCVIIFLSAFAQDGMTKILMIGFSVIGFFSMMTLRHHTKQIEQTRSLVAELEICDKQILALSQNRSKKMQKMLDKQEEKHRQYLDDLKRYQHMLEIAEGVLHKMPVAYANALRFFDPFEDMEEYGSELIADVSSDRILIDFYPACESVVPKSTKKILRKGLAIKDVEIPQTKLHLIYQDYVCSCVLKIAKEVFQLLPAVDDVYLNARSFLLNTATGKNEEQTILSVKINRIILENLNFELIDPSDSMVNFEHHMDFKRTAGFSPVSELKSA